MDEEERQEKLIILKKVFKIAPGVIVILFFLTLTRKYSFDDIEIWLNCMFLAIALFFIPQDKLKKIISRFIDVIAYTAIILGIVMIVFKYVLKII